MRIHSLARAFLFGLLLLIASTRPSIGVQGHKGKLRAGAAKIEITPDAPVVMGGYADRTSLSKGVHDPLYARAVAFENQGKQLVLVSLDLVGLGDAYEVLQKALFFEFGLQSEELVVAWTNTHSGPDPTLNKLQGHPNNVAFTEFLIPKVVRAVRSAINSMGPVQTAVSVGSYPHLAKKNSTSGGDSSGAGEGEVLVMKLVRPDGAPVASIFNYACHNTSLGPQNLQISGDVLGSAQVFIEKALGQGIVAPAFLGASGGLAPWYRVASGLEAEPGWIPEAVLFGTLLGEEVVGVYRNIKEISTTDEIKTAITTIQLPGRKAQSPEAGKDSGPAVSVMITAARVGNVVLIAIPATLGSQIGQKIKASSPHKNTFVITECNNKFGYIPSESQFKEGGDQLQGSRVGPEAGELVVKAALKLLEGL